MCVSEEQWAELMAVLEVIAASLAALAGPPAHRGRPKKEERPAEEPAAPDGRLS